MCLAEDLSSVFDPLVISVDNKGLRFQCDSHQLSFLGGPHQINGKHLEDCLNTVGCGAEETAQWV